MEEPIPVFRGLGYPPTPAPIPPQPSRRAQVIGILHLIFAVIYLSCGGIALLGLFLAPAIGSELAPTTVTLDSINSAVNTLISAALLFAGIMLLRRRAIGRQVTIVAAIVHAVLLLGLAVPSAIVATSDTSLSPQNAAERAGFMLGGVMGVCAALIVRMVYPVVAAVILWRKPEELELS